MNINQHLYSAPSRSLLRGAPDPGQAEKNSLEMVVGLRTATRINVFLLLCLCWFGCHAVFRSRDVTIIEHFKETAQGLVISGVQRFLDAWGRANFLSSRKSAFPKNFPIFRNKILIHLPKFLTTF